VIENKRLGLRIQEIVEVVLERGAKSIPQRNWEAVFVDPSSPQEFPCLTELGLVTLTLT